MASDPDLEAKYALNSKVMVGSSVLLFILILLVVLFRTYVYLCHHRRHRQDSLTTTTSKEERLDPSVLKSIPTFIFSSSTSTRRNLPDCAVCLSEFTDGDVCRMLPNCNHDFHCQCIDMWLGSHSNCPICRAPVHSHTEPGEGSSNFPEPIGCPRKPFSVIVELTPER